MRAERSSGWGGAQSVGRTTATAHGAVWSSRRLTDPSKSPANPPCPRDPVTRSAAPAASVAMVVAPLVMTQTFAQFTRADAGVYLPGAPFLLSAVIMTLAAVIYQMRGRRITG